MMGAFGAVAILLVTSVAMSEGVEVNVRLLGSKFFEGGLVEIWKDGAWGLLCDGNRRGWNLEAGHLVCQNLGFAKARRVDHGSTGYAQVPSEARLTASGLNCGQAPSLGNCQFTWGSQQCTTDSVAAVVCEPESRSACGQGATAFLGSCYKVLPIPETFVGAYQQCSKLKIGSSLVEITSSLENRLVSRLLEVGGQSSASFWTGGVVNRVLDRNQKFWHGSQSQIEFDNNLDERSAKEQPKGIVVQKDAKALSAPWAVEAFDKRNSFVCEFPPDDIGCIADDDQEGAKYSGSAAFDKDGIACLPWSQSGSDQVPDGTYNQCRNPDGAERPYCYIQRDVPSDCAIPNCGAARGAFTLAPPNCPTQQPATSNHCHKEEYSCLDGSCISKDYVCDGEPDCGGGEDERDCRRIASLFAKEEGFRLQGVTEPTVEETFDASEEECAKACYYSKRCCTSFSTRPGKDGRKDRCLLSTIFENQVFDTLVQKGSWNYHKLNVSQSEGERTCRGRRATCGSCCGSIDGLRLRNRKRGGKGGAGRTSNGQIVEVNVDGSWGSLCDDSFTMVEANLVCKQMGYHLGAKEVVRGAGRDRRDGTIPIASLKCGGWEKCLGECNLDQKTRCGSNQAVAVVCSEVEEGSCEEDEFHCSSGECVDIQKLCNGEPNCRDHSDEEVNRCGQRIEVRHSDQDRYGHNSGLLEVRHKGIWGTVCKEYFSEDEAKVFCRMLGYEGNATFDSTGDEVGQRKGSWPIWITLEEEGTCTGNEGSIEECHEPGLWEHYDECDHRDDVILSCTDKAEVDRNVRAVTSDYDSKQIVEQCGLWRKASDIHGDANPRIAGGVKVDHGTLPWQASIRLRGPADRTFHHCGAVIISPFHLLTTAHCLWDYRDTKGIYYVRVGDNVIEVLDKEEQEFDIEKIDFHEDFGVGPYLNNDIAVVHIKREGGSGGIKFGNKVGPACLPPKDLVLSPAINLTVSGWGKNGYDQSQRQRGTNFVSKLNMAVVPVIQRSACKEEKVYGPEKISLGMFCAGLLEGGPDTCQGDSGGPAVTFLRLSKFHETRATLVGLTSWGYGCGRENKPGVYTQVSRYVDWVYEKTRGDL